MKKCWILHDVTFYISDDVYSTQNLFEYNLIDALVQAVILLK